MKRRGKMSVPKSKRGEPKLEVLTKARELTKYTIKICSNERYFPKRYRWCITYKIIDAVLEISRLLSMANAVYMGDKEHQKEDWTLRRSYQMKALTNTYALLEMMDIAYQMFGIDGSKMSYWTGLVLEEQDLLRRWKKSDKERYE